MSFSFCPVDLILKYSWNDKWLVNFKDIIIAISFIHFCIIPCFIKALAAGQLEGLVYVEET